MPVKVFKLITGEEVLGDLWDSNETSITIKNPVAVVMQRMQSGETGLGFLPFMAYTADKCVEVNRSNIVISAEVDEQVVNQYNTIFGGLVVPPKTLITG